MVSTTLFLPQCNNQLVTQARTDEPQQQIAKKGGCKRRNRGERRGILSLLCRRLILSCSSLTSLLRFSVAMEPPKTVNAFSGGFAVSPNLDHELSPIFVWLSCCEGTLQLIFCRVHSSIFTQSLCLSTHDHDCQYCHCMEFVPACHHFINRTPLVFIFVNTYQFF